MGPAGMVVVIIREDLIREDLDPRTPVYMSYKTHADNGSMFVALQVVVPRRLGGGDHLGVQLLVASGDDKP